MTWQITVRPSGHQFSAEAKSTILEAGLRAGLNLDHGCTNGTCGDCKARLLSGSIKQSQHHDYLLGTNEKAQDYFLLCCHQAASDLVIQAHEISQPGEIPEQHISAKISKIDALQNDVIQLTIRTPRSQGLHFLAGQEVTLHFDGMRPEYLPIASCPCDNTRLRLHVKRRKGDPFSDLVFNRLKKNREVVLTGPLGEFTLDEASGRPLLMLAWETGFAPIASLVDHAIDKDPERKIALYWLAQQHYLLNYCNAWRDALDNFTCQAIQVGEASTEPFADVVAQIITRHKPLGDWDVYLALPAVQQHQMRGLLADAGVPAGQMHMALMQYAQGLGK